MDAGPVSVSTLQAIHEGTINAHSIKAGSVFYDYNSLKLWVQALPSPNMENFSFCLLFLIFYCTPLVPDTKIVEIFLSLVQQNHVDEDWVIHVGEIHLGEVLLPLVRRKESARYVSQAAYRLMGMTRKFPYDCREFQHFNGIGPKVALLGIWDAHGLQQGIPCDTHMCHIVLPMGCMVGTNPDGRGIEELMEDKKKGPEYEVYCACMEVSS
jgi:hypothetical protein